MIKENVIKAYNMAQKAHKGQMRKYSDNEYFIHPKRVARIIEDLTGDETLIIVALLHDVLEDTGIGIHIKEFNPIYLEFGEDIWNMVNELTSTKEGLNKFNSKAEYLIDKILNMSLGATIIKLADRLHNVKYLDRDCKTNKHLKFVKKYYSETRIILNEIRNGNANLENEVCMTLIGGIEYHLDYLSLKYK